MMKYFWIFSIVTFWGRGVAAQSGTAKPYQDKLSVRFNPLGLADFFDGNISAGIAYSMNQRWSLTADFSYIFYSDYISKNKGTSGYIIKPALRYYFSERRKFFLESTVWYKRSSYKMEDWLEKDIVNGVPAYSEYQVFRYRKRVVGINVQGGLQKSLMKNNLLRLEIYAGIGIRYKWQDVKNDPKAFYQLNGIFDDSFNGPDHLSPSIPHGLRLVYVIR